MPRTNAIGVQNKFVKGLITEATGLSFPEDACTDTDNCQFEITGLVRRRYPFDYEQNYVTSAQTLSSNVVSSFVWKNAGGTGDNTFVVVQIGNTLHYYKVGGPNNNGSISGNKHSHTTDLTSFLSSGTSTVQTLECQYAFGNGLLFVTNRRLESFYVSYDASGDALSETQITIQIRDFNGDSADANADSERPTSTLSQLNANHHYNLLNQGWTDTNLTAWDAARTDMPSNCDVNWYFKNSSDAFDFTTVNNKAVNNSLAPKGHFIYTYTNINRSSNQAGATDSSISLERVSTCAFFAGRVFYSGVHSALNNSKIYFSQIAENQTQYGKCYQSEDPTSETLFDLLPSDGGVIDVIGAGEIFKLLPLMNMLLVFATNGVWAITGSSGAGFAANDYAISKISAITNISPNSFVNADGTPYWWNIDGVYTVTLNPQTNTPRVVSVTDETIRTFFFKIPLESKLFARGVYDPAKKKIQWIYRSNAISQFEDNYSFDRVLTFNLITTAFYPWSVDTSAVRIHSIVDIVGLSNTVEIDNVVNSGNQVVNGSNTIISPVSVSTGVSSTVMFVTSSSGNVTFSLNRTDRTDRLDWFTADGTGTDYDSYIVSGYADHGQGAKKFQANYIFVVSDVSEDSGSFQIRGVFDYAASSDSNRWSIPQTFTLTSDGNYGYKTNKIKIRGQGLSLQFRIENNGSDPFNIVGWSTFETGNQWI